MNSKTVESYFLFFIASVIGGVINAIAGGGGLITFPPLMLVVGAMTPDATSAMAGFASYPTTVWRTRNLLTGILVRQTVVGYEANPAIALVEIGRAHV